MKGLAGVYALCIAGALLVSQSACRPMKRYSSWDNTSSHSSSIDIMKNLRRLIMAVHDAMTDAAKRGCNDFACIRSRMGARVSQQARARTIADILRNCAHDPSCAPGKRSGYTPSLSNMDQDYMTSPF